MNGSENCEYWGVARRRLVRVVTDERLQCPAYLADMRALTSSLGISPDEWPDFLSDIYRDFPGSLSNEEGHLVSLNLEHLEVYREWYRDWVNTPVPSGVMPRLKSGSKARIRVLATLLRIAFPQEEKKWGNRADNDGVPRLSP